MRVRVIRSWKLFDRRLRAWRSIVPAGRAVARDVRSRGRRTRRRDGGSSCRGGVFDPLEPIRRRLQLGGRETYHEDLIHWAIDRVRILEKYPQKERFSAEVGVREGYLQGRVPGEGGGA